MFLVFQISQYGPIEKVYDLIINSESPDYWDIIQKHKEKGHSGKLISISDENPLQDSTDERS